jgi:serine/threonine protein kinase
MSLCINPHCGQPQNADNVLFCEICGSQLLLGGKYRVVKVLSKKGGFANTYEVTAQQQTKVLKVLKSEAPKAVELFAREFEVLSGLQVAGIPEVEDLFLYKSFNSTQPMYCIVMEKIEGVDLEEYLVELRQPIDQKLAVNWLTQMIQILQPLHKQGIYHRDIKPSNIILQPDGQLVLIDFGAVSQSGPSLSKTLIHTPGYTSPEQEKGKTSAFSDIFSLARTMVYLLTYQDPKDLHNVQHNEFRWRHLNDSITSDLMDLIDNMMHNEVRQRPNARAILETIASLNGTHISRIPGISFATDRIKPRATATKLSGHTPRKSFWIIWLGMFSLFGLGLMTGCLWKNRMGQKNSPTSNRYFLSVKNISIGQQTRVSHLLTTHCGPLC